MVSNLSSQKIEQNQFLSESENIRLFENSKVLNSSDSGTSHRFPSIIIRKMVIYHADFITDTDGTGIGHEAPEFGDVDFQLAKKEGIFISEAMDEAGKYTAQIHDYEGLHYQEANKVNIERMKENGTLFKNE
jgi:isoleucyl-tRNA synthetase